MPTRRSFVTTAAAGLTGLGALHTARATAQTPATPALVRPPRLKPGDTVGLVNPAGATWSTIDIDIVKAMAAQGNPNSVSDAGVGALMARSAVLGAMLNVKINAAGLKDRSVAEELIGEAERIAREAEKLEKEVLEIVHEKID